MTAGPVASLNAVVRSTGGALALLGEEQIVTGFPAEISNLVLESADRRR